MADVTQLLSGLGAYDPNAAAQLLPLVYDELRKLAARKLAAEKPGQTLQATVLVHEAYLRLAGHELRAATFANRAHFFAAAPEVMRRIPVEAARRKGRVRHGGGRRRVELADLPAAAPPDESIAMDDALGRLAERDPAKAEVVKLPYFAGLTVSEVAAALNISVATAEWHWAFARTWLFAELNDSEEIRRPAEGFSPDSSQGG
jgi:RNA polymerase sigma factor (TIGR02999 family)